MDFKGFLDRLPAYFEDKGDNRTALAERAGYDKTLVKQWMEGRVSNPRTDTIEGVCQKGMGMSYDEFMKRYSPDGPVAPRTLRELLQEELRQLEDHELESIKVVVEGLRAVRSQGKN